jgi:hypothetical protein
MKASARAALSSRRLSKCNMLHFLSGAVGAELLAVAMQLEKTYLLPRASDKITARLPGTGTLKSHYLVGNTWCIDKQQLA